MKHAITIAARTLTVFIGLSLILMSVLLYETEEGKIENTLEKWWVFLSDTERRAVGKHVSFVATVASLADRLFDRLLGENLLSLRAVGISACFSIASLGIVSSPALNGSFIFLELPTLPYCITIVCLLVMGFLPAILGVRLREKLWFVGIAVLMFVSLAGMDSVNWFSVPYRNGSISEPVEFLYDLLFLVVTVASDALFIIATRWLLRICAKLTSNTKVLGVMFGNVLLAFFLVALPLFLAWGISGLKGVLYSPRIVDAAIRSVEFASTRATFLSSLAASNALDGFVACSFFILLFALLAHRLLWPTLQRPVYALATRGVVRRRKLSFTLGLFLVGVGGFPQTAMTIIEKLWGGLLN